MKIKFKYKDAFTLVELIVTLAILSLVITFISSMLLMGYRQIISSGKKNEAAVTTQLKVEDTLSGDNVNVPKTNYINNGSSTLNFSLIGDDNGNHNYTVTGENFKVDFTGDKPFSVTTFTINNVP